MLRRTHHVRLQRMERALGICVCQQLRVLVCAKDIAALERGELPEEPCPAGCPPGRRPVVALNMSAWRNGEECVCPICDPRGERRRALAATVPEPVAAAQLALPAPADASPDTDGPEAGPDAARAPAGSYGPAAGCGVALLEPLAREAVIDVGRPVVQYPLGEAQWRAQRSAEYARLAALLAEKDRIIAENTEELARLRTEIDRLRADTETARRLRREQEHNTPSGGPVHVPGLFGQG